MALVLQLFPPDQIHAMYAGGDDAVVGLDRGGDFFRLFSNTSRLEPRARRQESYNRIAGK